MSPLVVPDGMMILIALLLACSLINCHQINDPNCGIVRTKARGHTNRIVGGSDAKPGAWPWQVLLRASNEYGDQNFCGASVINKKFVLTAAHCVMDARGYLEVKAIVAGAHYFSKPLGREQTRRAAGIFAHPDYDYTGKRIGNDIALIKMDRPFDFNQWVRPVCLPDKSDDTLDLESKPTLTGWGFQSMKGSPAVVLQQVVLKVSEDDVCLDHDLSRTICALGVQRGTSACYGDSGGPLVYSKNKRWVEYGVFSRMTTSCDRYSHFTKTSAYLDWIASTIENNNW